MFPFETERNFIRYKIPYKINQSSNIMYPLFNYFREVHIKTWLNREANYSLESTVEMVTAGFNFKVQFGI